MTSFPTAGVRLGQLADAARAACRAFTGGAPEFVVQSPGRVNLIGEHTDYNDGLVLPMAIDRWTVIAGRRRPDGLVRLRSDAAPGVVEFAPGDLKPGQVTGWGAYVAGMADALAAGGRACPGWEGAVVSTIPVGAGLSSSAALELATAAAFVAASGQPWDPESMARAGQWAEHRWAGTQCGLMDQLAVALAREDHALLLDCRDFSRRSVRLPGEVAVVVLDTGCRRELGTSEYNRRREECQAGARAAGVSSLRDLAPGALAALEGRVDPVVWRRVRHVVTENSRVRGFVEALEWGDCEGAGRWMAESHESLRADYEVSGPELDSMVEAARRAPGCLGARLTGAGFGGCAVALVRAAELGDFTRSVLATYRLLSGRDGVAHPVQAPGAAGRMEE